MINDEQMLRLIMKNAEMGCRGINEVKHHAKSFEMSKALYSQNKEYGKIYTDANRMLHCKGIDAGHQVGPMQIAMTKMVARHELQKDSSNKHIAEMMIKGNTMGVNKLVKNMRKYTNQNQSVINLAGKFMDTQQSNIEQMKGFLFNEVK